VDYEAVIGLEVHAQLLTRSKMFCSCAAKYRDASPNTMVCPVCLALPGVLPVVNRQAVIFTIMTGLALHCAIAEETKFDRKNYPYPDLMKGYQISQFDQPIASAGYLVINQNGTEKRIGITRVHLEEDVAKMSHHHPRGNDGYSLVDVNRAGVPLMEVVGDPDLRSPEEARDYLTQLRSILQYLGVSTGNMQEGGFRCDANISVRPQGDQNMFPKVEVKNMNSFRAVVRALEYEFDRQTQIISIGGIIEQETRGWIEERGVTVSQRSKESAHDYRFFPEPDLPPVMIGRDWVEEIRSALPELPEARRNRLITEYGLSLYDANLLTSSKATADFYEDVLRIQPLEGQALYRRAKAISNWMLGEMTRLLNALDKSLSEVAVAPDHLSALQDFVDSDTLSNTMAKDVFEEMFSQGKHPSVIVAERGLSQMNDSTRLLPIIEEVLDRNAQPVQDYLSGKESASKFLLGQVMKLTQGSANPEFTLKLLVDRLKSLANSKQ
jgi:aspartyl-tRNA(Asn)/glutamyl-tRNA(Gln) amidotransferase subunit B